MVGTLTCDGAPAPSPPPVGSSGKSGSPETRMAGIDTAAIALAGKLA
ncbi:hypothetical protein JI749_04265 [Devosia oryziradicis]|uniref:Uncharacterized protein n=1 Tax=Devosia oryziradicis TaxID=2801335 RepID=A0ABX7BZA2_9HYPH|nr:hypothetical protein [Devosia oryziradicis]QQR36853.1 hypothetical protein JI749_04265 [Devosia oryziradicis]